MVPSVAKPCAMPMPKPISCPRRLQVAVKAPMASRNSSAMSTAWSAGDRDRIVENHHHAVASIAFECTVVLDDDFADCRVVIAQQGFRLLGPRRAVQVPGLGRQVLWTE